MIPAVVATDNKAQQNKTSRMHCSLNVVRDHRFWSDGRSAADRVAIVKRAPSAEMSSSKLSE